MDGKARGPELSAVDGASGRPCRVACAVWIPATAHAGRCSVSAEGPGRRNGGAGAPGVGGPPQATGSSDTPLFPGRMPAGGPQNGPTRPAVNGAARSKLLRLRQQARAEWRAAMQTGRGLGPARARYVLDMCKAAGVPTALAVGASAAAFLLMAADDDAHAMDDSLRYGLRQALGWLQTRAPEEYMRLRDYDRGLREPA